MYKITKHVDFCYGHRLMNYAGKCRHLHGHNGKAEIVLEARTLDERAMVRDFDEVKTKLGAWIDANLDHKMLLRRDDPAIALLNQIGEPYYLLDTNPTAEAIARLIYNAAVAEDLPVVEVRLWETPTSFATYAGD
jgi:6-pyruvoyltetrahydropterin/6-carboxytetrahydropterin synthase